MQRHRNRSAVALIALGAAACATTSSGPACDRACLLDLADDYLAAIVAHDPARAPLAEGLRFVENITAMEPGEGLWASAAGPATGFRIVVPDPVSGEVGLIVILPRSGADGDVPAFLAARLKVEDGAITEAEHLVSDVPAEADLARLVAPRPNLIAVVPTAERMSRAALIATAAPYYDALAEADGSLAPFAADCERQEGGLVTAGPGPAPPPSEEPGAAPPTAFDCAGQLSSRRYAYIDAIDNRRIFAADPVQGLVMGLSHFRQGMDKGPFEITALDGSTVMWEDTRPAYDLPAAHIFKVTGGEIHEVEAVGIFTPYMSPTGWE
jgi:hypothetical protein